jgi:hypothetical protein
MTNDPQPPQARRRSTEADGWWWAMVFATLAALLSHGVW